MVLEDKQLDLRLHFPTQSITRGTGQGEGEKPTSTCKPQAPEETVGFKTNSVPSVFKRGAAAGIPPTTSDQMASRMLPITEKLMAKGLCMAWDKPAARLFALMTSSGPEVSMLQVFLTLPCPRWPGSPAWGQDRRTPFLDSWVGVHGSHFFLPRSLWW